jgi:hypothetical protein
MSHPGPLAAAASAAGPARRPVAADWARGHRHRQVHFVPQRFIGIDAAVGDEETFGTRALAWVHVPRTIAQEAPPCWPIARPYLRSSYTFLIKPRNPLTPFVSDATSICRACADGLCALAAEVYVSGSEYINILLM